MSWEGINKLSPREKDELREHLDNVVKRYEAKHKDENKLMGR